MVGPLGYLSRLLGGRRNPESEVLGTKNAPQPYAFQLESWLPSRTGSAWDSGKKDPEEQKWLIKIKEALGAAAAALINLIL